MGGERSVGQRFLAEEAPWERSLEQEGRLAGVEGAESL
jgi:hypothetical protein